jgi:hypothetical protein
MAASYEVFAPFVRQGPFKFFSEVAELRIKVYEHLLTDTRPPRLRKVENKDGLFVDVPEIVECEIHVNDLARRKERRLVLLPVSTGLSPRSKKLAKKHRFLNETSATTARLTQKVNNAIPFLETAILRTNEKTYKEALYTLYATNVFTIMFPLNEQTTPFHTLFPSGVDISRIQRLSVEVQLDPHDPQNRHVRTPWMRSTTWASFRKMTDLKFLRIVITFCDPRHAPLQADLFNRAWRRTNYYNNVMRNLIAAVPKDVVVTCGLSKEQRERGDYGGLEPVKGCVLKKIFRVYECLRGVDGDMENEAVLTLTEAGDLPVDGDGEDSEDDDGGAAAA